MIRDHLSVAQTRSLFMTFGVVTTYVCLLLPYYICSEALGTVLILVGTSSIWGFSQAYNVNYNDICPHYSGVLNSMGNTLANLSGLCAPVAAGIILGDHSVPVAEDWQRLFFIMTAFAGAGLAFFVTFVQGQPIQAIN